MSEPDTSRSSVKTYVPTYQKQQWADHADELGMTQSEFVRTMVQAGRRGFDLEGEDEKPEAPVEPSNPGGNALEGRVQEVLHRRGVMSWDQLVEALSGDFESRLEETLDSLQSANRIRYNGREGGYVVTDSE
ncbi:hypothetical protein AUR64_05155 [Haloprofundus marisrubri]|uniref:Uncharacterized protein n=1 Tax=Haloprofundus marisrubri TaxID=1514971 RepID=A0A0W1REW6_9EURY|nr:DUF5805 domain-containing protein [Haloprofundus marisrubri]KTG11177.1 hypothetical protein AUR64_05155 [Haloprofundus marisrubri]